MTRFFQKHLKLRAYPSGYHLITGEVESAIPEIKEVQIGFLQVFIQHTSAGLTLNENADPTVRREFQTFMNELIPESYPRFFHQDEGPDDMPAHIKAAFFGNSLQIPITGGKLNLGTWQGIYLCEFRRSGGCRNLVLTLYGETK